MSIRLNQALRELNIGMQTAVEFLQKKSELGEVKADLSYKLNERQHAALVEAFKQDAALRTDVEKLFGKKKDKKRPQTAKPIETRTGSSVLEGTGHQTYKPLGKIDLSKVGKKPVVIKSDASQPKKAEPTTAAVSHPQPAPAQQKAEQQPARVQSADNAAAKPQSQNLKPEQAKVEPAKQEPKAESHVDKAANAQQKQETVKPAAQKSEQKPAQKPAAPKIAAVKVAEVVEPKQDSKVFQLSSEKKILSTPKVNVLGKIDLDSINQSTRPKKKSKEERRREREAKQNGGNGGNNNDHKKRQRINKDRVDINAAANQQGNGQGKKKKNRKRGGQKPAEVTEEDVARQVKETLARLTSKQSQTKKGAKYRKEKREAVQEKLNQEARAEKKESKILKLTEFVTVSELATMMNVGVNQVISTLMSIGVMASINQRLDAETINLVADEFGFKTEYVSAEVQEAVSEEQDDESELVPRAPIVTVMGHVDHGKTSLLDHIRNTNVIAGEAGGITQHIGAYSVTLKNGRKVTFLDTPGHEAFTAMRARGAQVTDIAIIIIAADDSVMPTTKEAIAHCQAAGVPMVFAINKIDKPGANPEKIKEELAAMNLLVEDWGGKYQSQDISAKKGIGVKELLDKVLLEADMLELKANPNRKATGTVIESSLDKGRGYVATVIVSNGTLHIGDNVIAGTCYGRVKDLGDERGKHTNDVGPAHATIILGLNGAPQAGDTFHVMDTEQEVKEIANKRLQLQREQGLRTHKLPTLDELGRRIALGGFQELNLIVKGDTDGSVEALSDSFIKLSTEKIAVNVIHKGVGQINETDVTLAAASQAIIIGFQVRPSADARRVADQEGVDIRIYSVIYDAIHDVKDAMEGMLKPVLKEEVTATLEVRQVYHISKVGTVAGAFVTDGKVHRTDKARLIRDGIVKFTGEINALKRFKDDVKEVGVNFECGISLTNCNDIAEGDIIETFREVEVKQTL